MTRPSIRIVVHGAPQPKGSARAFIPKGWKRPIITSDNKSLKTWEQTIRTAVQAVMAETEGETLRAIFDAPIAVLVLFHLPRPKTLPKRAIYPTKKPDLDKLARAAVDAINGVLVRDDAQMIALGTQKVYAATAPYVEILVESWASPGQPATLDGVRSLLDFTTEVTQ